MNFEQILTDVTKEYEIPYEVVKEAFEQFKGFGDYPDFDFGQEDRLPEQYKSCVFSQMDQYLVTLFLCSH